MSDTVYDVAVVGMAGRFPGADDLDGYWRRLDAGVDSFRRYSRDELAAAGVAPALLDHPDFVPIKGKIDGAGLLDAAFFGISPREARLIDPQQRLFLECAWQALEDAGCVPGGDNGAVGVYAGMSQSSYYLANLQGNPEALQGVDPIEVKLGNDKDFLATAISYRLDLHGPSVNVSTACSTSLVAVHLACQALLNGECDLALAGGVTVAVPRDTGYLALKNGIMALDGCCRAFDRDATGTLPGEGLGIVVLRRLADALEAGDRIHAVIKGSAINNDGARKIGFAAPSVEGQAAAIAEAYEAAAVDPATVSYVETHGSGTPLGDLVELRALQRVFGASAAGCAIGSVKTNVGHCDAAAGIAGLLKTILALKHRRIPASLHLREPNPNFDWSHSALRVAADSQDWPVAEGAARRAGVSSFGIGGTNAHVVLEEAPPPAAAGGERGWQLLVLSAATEPALEAASDRLARHLERRAEPSLTDLAYTLAIGRRTLRHRRILVARERAEVIAALDGRAGQPLPTLAAAGDRREVAFLLTGVGDQYPGMARGLYRDEAAFREPFDRCAELLAPQLGVDLRQVVFATAGGEGETEGSGPDLRRMLKRSAGEGGALDDPAVQQPAVFAVVYSLASMWRAWGIRPVALLGYSLGEYAAACLAEVLPLADALALVAERARLIGEAEPGGMLAVGLSRGDATGRLAGYGLDSRLWVAADNAPELCVVAGPPAPLDELADRLAADGVSCRRLATARAVHTPMMEPVAGRLAERLAGARLQPPKTPLISNVTGTWLSDEEATDPRYWRRHLHQPLCFTDGLATLFAMRPAPLLLEVGPGQGLSSLATQGRLADGGASEAALPSLRPAYDRREDSAFTLETLGRLWLAGAEVDWQAFYAGARRRKVSLPTYPFERQRYWVDPPRRHPAEPVAPAARIDSLVGPVSDDPLSDDPLSGDRLASPAPASEAEAAVDRHARPSLAQPYVAPRDATEEALAEIWQAALRIDRVGVHDSFFELGGNSLLAPRILLAVEARLGIELPLPRLLAEPRIADLARAVAEIERGGAAVLAAEPDLAVEASTLPAEVRAVVGARRGEAVVLTGATGFLGAFLLRDLLAREGGRVLCPVRAASAEEGRARVWRNLEGLGLASSVPSGAARRVVAIPADLARPEWGLDPAASDALAGEVGAIFHAGAWVNFTYPYSTLRAANVGGTDQALRLAGRSGATLHFISSLSVLVPDPEDPSWIGREDAPLSASEGRFGGYAQSKWVAEKHIHLARERGIDGRIYRGGLIAGDGAAGLSNPRDLMWNFLKGCLQMRLAPALDLPFDPVPADYVSRAILHLAGQPPAPGVAYHFFNPRPIPWRELFEIARGHGYPLEIVSPGEWHSRMARAIRQAPDNALAPFWPLLGQRFAVEPGQEERGLETGLTDDTHTRRGLEGSGIECPPITSDLVGRWIGSFVASGFLPPPAPGPAVSGARQTVSLTHS